MELSGMRLLILEDDYLIGLELERIAEECSAKSVHLVTTVDALLAWIERKDECDIAILEVQAKGTSSFEAARILQLRGVPVVFTTAYDHERNGVSGFPCAPVVTKPYGRNQIIQAAAALSRSYAQD